MAADFGGQYSLVTIVTGPFAWDWRASLMGLASIFGENVREARRAKGMTLEALAHDVELAYSYVGELERGRRNPTLNVVERLAKALGQDPVDLLTKPHRSVRLDGSPNEG